VLKKIEKAPIFFDRYRKWKEEWDYIKDPTFSRSIGSHVCMTCSKFDYLSHVDFSSILCCNLHQKLICHGQHLTHSCALYKKKGYYSIYKKNNQPPQVA
tara:strand:+ start:210 stop:506 length:297 start_codon:yes stop_codon:yes gene_type:complete